MSAEPETDPDITRCRADRPLRDYVQTTVEQYLENLNGEPPRQMYELVLTQMEQPLLEAVLRHAKGNISRAADYLGMNRATLRRKLQKYRIQV